MKKLIERLLLFFAGLPLLIASVLLLPHYNYLVLHIEVLIVAVFAIIEMRDLLSKKLPVAPLWFALFTGLMLPLAAFLHAVVGLPYRIIPFALIFSCLSILSYEFFACFSGKFDRAVGRLSSSFSILLYPGYLIMYLGIMTIWPNAGAFLSVFFMIVFGTDSLAWFFGMIFGKNNRGIIPASPNKSIAGFIGGYFGAVLAAVLGFYMFNSVFCHCLTTLIFIALATATAAIIGDIFESVLKRSSGIKDSGSGIPGRGGVLDSIDSVLLAAPVFYILVDLFLGA
ncbi:MAG TPA: phosphatidate cytidylyltransferase [Treponema sp.]|nr:phosphatidate cytidylyltransferase [Treponema sp.]